MWEPVRLGEVCTLLNGRAYKKPELLDDGKYPVLRVGNFFTNRGWYYSDLELDPSKYCDTGDLLYAWSASFGPRIWDGGKVIYHYHIWKTCLDELRVYKKFLYYWFEWDVERIKSEQGAGTTMVHVTKKSMEERKLFLPPLPEQQRIVAILDEAFERIDAAIKNTQANLTSARELFESYLNRVFTEKGEGWVETQIGEIADVSYGYTAKASFEKDGPKFLRITDIQNESVDWDTVPMCEIGSKEYSRHKLVEDDIVFARTGATTGKSFIVKAPPDAVAASYLIRLRIKTPDVAPGYVAKFFFTSEYWNTVNAGISGSAQGGFNASKLSSLRLPLPPLREQQRIVLGAGTLLEKSHYLGAVYQDKLDALQELKQSILAKAFRGELTSGELAA